MCLSMAEAQTLADILDMVGGDPTRSRRKHAAAILEALETVDVGGKGNSADIHGAGITFDNRN